MYGHTTLVCDLIGRRRRITNEILSEEEFFVLVDDCFCSESVMRSKALNMLVLNGRSLGISVILTVHSCVDIPPRIRVNIDYLFTFAIHNAAHQKWLYEHHFPAFESLDVFRDTLQANTENYKALVLNNTVKSGEIKDTVSWYKAAVHEPDGHRGFSESDGELSEELEVVRCEIRCSPDRHYTALSGLNLRCRRSESERPILSISVLRSDLVLKSFWVVHARGVHRLPQDVDRGLLLLDGLVPRRDVPHHALVAVLDDLEARRGHDRAGVVVLVLLVAPPRAPQTCAVRSRQREAAAGRLALPLVEGAVLPSVPASRQGATSLTRDSAQSPFRMRVCELRRDCRKMRNGRFAAAHLTGQPGCGQGTMLKEHSDRRCVSMLSSVTSSGQEGDSHLIRAVLLSSAVAVGSGTTPPGCLQVVQRDSKSGSSTCAVQR